MPPGMRELSDVGIDAARSAVVAEVCLQGDVVGGVVDEARYAIDVRRVIRPVQSPLGIAAGSPWDWAKETTAWMLAGYPG